VKLATLKMVLKARCCSRAAWRRLLAALMHTEDVDALRLS